MDEEDYGEFGLLENKIVTKKAHEIDSGKKEFSYTCTENLLSPVNEGIGVQLLMNMGWKPGHGIGPRVTFAMKRKQLKKHAIDALDDQPEFVKELTFAPHGVDLAPLQPKTDMFGIGYKRLSSDSLGSIPKKNFSDKVLFSDVLSNSARQSTTKNFWLGALENADKYDDVYDSDHFSQYDQTIVPVKQSNEKRKSLEVSHNYESLTFLPSTTLDLDGSVLFPPPKVPSSFSERHVFTDDKVAFMYTTKKKLSSDDRGRMLGTLAEKKGSVFSYLKKENVERLMAFQQQKKEEKVISKSKTRWDSDQPYQKHSNSDNNNDINDKDKHETNSTEVTSYISAEVAKAALEKNIQFSTDDTNKQQRYQQFLQLHVDGTFKREKIWGKSAGLTEWAVLQELQDFTRAAIMFQPMSAIFSNRFVSATIQDNIEGDAPHLKTPETPQEAAARRGTYGQLTRTQEIWLPSKLLCKRLGIPYSHATPPPPKCQSRNPILPLTLSGPLDPSAAAAISKPLQENISESTFEESGAKPSMEIFKAIFENFDDEVDDEDDDEQLTNPLEEEKKEEQYLNNAEQKPLPPLIRPIGSPPSQPNKSILGPLINMTDRSAGSQPPKEEPSHAVTYDSDSEWTEKEIFSEKESRKKKEKKKKKKKIVKKNKKKDVIDEFLIEKMKTLNKKEKKKLLKSIKSKKKKKKTSKEKNSEPHKHNTDAPQEKLPETERTGRRIRPKAADFM
ncbi:G patch domain-containing protein 1-like [Zophobas morio]|uniref:G patch domain-containing protein 1-like n=1 Tax=Zophobas morio TaxID=2755281 RepID=UPI003083710B